MRAVLGSFGSEADDVPVGLVVELEAVPPVTGLAGHRRRWKPSIMQTKRRRLPHYKDGKKLGYFILLQIKNGDIYAIIKDKN